MDAPRTIVAVVGEDELVDPLVLVPDDEAEVRDAIDVEGQVIAVGPNAAGQPDGGKA